MSSSPPDKVRSIDPIEFHQIRPWFAFFPIRKIDLKSDQLKNSELKCGSLYIIFKIYFMIYLHIYQGLGLERASFVYTLAKCPYTISEIWWNLNNSWIYDYGEVGPVLLLTIHWSPDRYTLFQIKEGVKKHWIFADTSGNLRPANTKTVAVILRKSRWLFKPPVFRYWIPLSINRFNSGGRVQNLDCTICNVGKAPLSPWFQLTPLHSHTDTYTPFYHYLNLHVQMRRLQ